MHQGRLGVDQALKLNLNPIKSEGSECIASVVGGGRPIYGKVRGRNACL